MDNCQEDDKNFNFLGSSPYFDDDGFIKHISFDKKRFTIFSTNIQSLHAKSDELLLLIAKYNSGHHAIDVICLQETWCL